MCRFAGSNLSSDISTAYKHHRDFESVNFSIKYVTYVRINVLFIYVLKFEL
jgi:hypothetical protein